MNRTRKKTLACFVAAIMAISVMGGSVLSAFADDLAAGIGELTTQSSEGPIVYDTAYGALHGQYAIMVKTVTYEEEYKGKMTTLSATITDLMRADGEVTVHTSTAANDNDAIPGEWTNYRHKTIANEGLDVMAGYMEVADKDTGKCGVKSVDGDEILPCSYDVISAVQDGLLGYTFGDGSVTFDFFTLDGTPCGSFSSTADIAKGYAYSHYYGDVVSIKVRNTADEELTIIARKVGSQYVQDDSITKIYNYDDEDALLYAGSDGNVHYQAPDGSDKVIASAQGVSSGSLRYQMVELRTGNGWVYYNTDGTKLADVGEGSVGARMQNAFVFRPANSAAYEVRDYSNKVLNTLVAARVSDFRDDPDHFEAWKLVSEDTYELGIYDTKGNLVKTIGTTDDQYDGLASCSGTLNGEKAVLGYRRGDERTGEVTFYDTAFNVISYNPMGAREFTLPDGKVVMTKTTSQWNPEERSYDNQTTTTDLAMNPVTLGGYTLNTAADKGLEAPWNIVKHGNADLWWATDSEGHWGAVNSAGEVVVPFEYESYYDSGLTDTDYALVKKDGQWMFLKVSNGESGPDLTMHRLYNEWSGEHFYTSDNDEYENLVALGWRDEGAGWIAPTVSATPVYRLYNPYAGEHHYTMKADERDSMVDAGWTYEDIGWYSADAKTTPLFREYNPNEFSNNHNYTTDAEEHATLISLGWVDEGYAWYGL